jgi:hypothetical protein
MDATISELDTIRERALEILRREARPMGTGELAILLREPAYRVPIALDELLQRGAIQFTDGGTWEIAP